MKIERLWQGNAVTIVGTVELDTLEARIEALARGRNEIHGKWFGALLRIEALDKENRALRANVSKSVLRRLEGQGVLRGEEEK